MTSTKFWSSIILLPPHLSIQTLLPVTAHLVGVSLLEHLDGDGGVLPAVDDVGGGGLHHPAEGPLPQRLSQYAQFASLNSLLRSFGTRT